ncbi:hypothetical protein [Streptomyces sp. 2224.1]|uniref:hypothetical protein n=1 Tax=Streptomyces sp. 2224.1 TaxID=1881020 RepID=UPI0015A23082|nr:hypothetical protein [Streptomyces sp. 2224.1]
MSSDLADRVGEGLLDQAVGGWGEGEGVALGEVVASAGGDPVDLVQPVQRRNAGFDAGAASGFHDERQVVQQAGQIVGVGRGAALFLDAHPAGQHVLGNTWNTYS